jgi:ABC-type cobalamin transport system ATPase subunit
MTTTEEKSRQEANGMLQGVPGVGGPGELGSNIALLVAVLKGLFKVAGFVLFGGFMLLAWVWNKLTRKGAYS